MIPFSKFRTPPIPEFVLDPEYERAVRREDFRHKTFHALCAAGEVRLHNLPSTVFDWIDSMFDELEARNNG